MERKHEPTPRKLKKAKERGEVGVSRECVAALMMVGGVGMLWGLASLFKEGFLEVFLEAWGEMDAPLVALKRAVMPMIKPVGLFLGGVALLAVGATLFQTGWVFSFQRLKPKWPKREKHLLYGFVLGALKVGILVGGGWIAFTFVPHAEILQKSPAEKLDFIAHRLFFLMLGMALLFLVLGIGDFFVQKVRFHRQMRMTDQELKEERRETEGDPQIKQERQNRRKE